MDADAGTSATGACVPEAGSDEPDEDFTDTNCDGIDGDASAAVFVAPGGSDDGRGTVDSPLLTLGKAVQQAARSGKAVYVCNGEYPENVTLDHVSVSLYGGYDCANRWERRRDRAVVIPPRGVPLVIDGATGPVVVERLALRAADATEPSGSSIAASVHASASVRFVQSELTAGNGADGTDGGPAEILAMMSMAPEPGKSAPTSITCTTLQCGAGPRDGDDAGCWLRPAGGQGALAVCPNGELAFGGAGGQGGNFALAQLPTPGVAGSPPSPSAAPNGDPGAAGEPGLAGESFGTIVGGLYVATNGGRPGQDGHLGFPGWGGAGGTSHGSGSPVMTYSIGGGGGQGGLPGCGGYGGRPGKAGGASMALVSDGSRVAIDWSLLTTAHGGHGGGGSSGAPGLVGARGAPGGRGAQAYAEGHAGGRGGDGGRGGPGGPGGGGPSIAIAFQGPMPSTTAPGITLGEPGRGGTSGAETAPSGITAERYGSAGALDAGK